MESYRSNYFKPDPQADRQLHYLEWGDPGNSSVLVCMHGLTRNARDFEFIADALSERYRVISLDFAGRGNSDWLSNPVEYDYPVYLNDALALLNQSGVDSVDWLGTSMGGVVGMLMASMHPQRINRLILNDIGAFVPKAALDRIKASLDRPHTYSSIESVEALVRRVHATFGQLTQAQWRFLADISTKLNEEGGYRLHYDPGIAEPFRAKELDDADLWPVWELIQVPVLVLRGVESDVLPEKVAQKMAQSRERVELIEFAQTGHAPALMDKDQIGVVQSWLARAQE